MFQLFHRTAVGTALETRHRQMAGSTAGALREALMVGFRLIKSPGRA